MITVQDVYDRLKELAPPAFREDWDNVGLLCGRDDRVPDRILIALDPFLDVAQEAADLGAQLIVTHHPLLFDTKSVTDGDQIGKTLLFLIEHEISLICMHTNLDSAPGGVNDALAGALGLQDTAVLSPAGTDALGRSYGLGRVGSVPETSLADFALHVKQRLGCAGLRYANAGRPVRRVAVCGGAGSSYLSLVRQLGCDTYVTGDVRYNGFWDAVDLGINLIDAGHFPTENVVCPVLQSCLQTAFPSVRCMISRVHGDVIRFL